MLTSQRLFSNQNLLYLTKTMATSLPFLSSLQITTLFNIDKGAPYHCM